MSDWRRAYIVGTCSPTEVPQLRELLKYDRDTMDGFHCLCCGGIVGLPNWAAASISAVGNLAERGYDADSVAETLEDLAKSVPSLAVDVHLGKTGETAECEHTISLAAGKATVSHPALSHLPTQPEHVARSNMSAMMAGSIYR